MRRRTFLATTGSIAALAGCAGNPLEQVPDLGSGSSTPEAPLTVRMEQAVFEEVNVVRREYDRVPLEMNDELRAAAREHSQNMAEQQVFTHRDLEEDQERVSCPENIARGGSTDYDPKSVALWTTAGWLESPGHRRIMLSTEWTVTGVGVAIGEEWTYVTQDFC